MKHSKSFLFFSAVILSALTCSFAAFAAESRIEGKGEVVSVDPMLKRITIKHGVIKGFSAAGETSFLVKSESDLKGLSRYDLVSFTVAADKDNERIDFIIKTGVADPGPDGLPVGKAIQDVLEATGGAAKAVTSPIPPAHTVVSGAVDGTTNATGAVLEDATTEVKAKF